MLISFFFFRIGLNISSVQFVISTDGAELPEVAAVVVEEEYLTFWDRLLTLFGLGITLLPQAGVALGMTLTAQELGGAEAR